MRGNNQFDDNKNFMNNEFDQYEKSHSSGMIEEKLCDEFDFPQSTNSWDPEPALNKHNSGIVMCSEAFDRSNNYNLSYRPYGCNSETNSNGDFNFFNGKNYEREFDSENDFYGDYGAVHGNEERMIVEGESSAIAMTNMVDSLMYDRGNRVLPNHIQNNLRNNNLEIGSYDRNLHLMQNQNDDFYKNNTMSGTTGDSDDKYMRKDKSIFGCNQIDTTKESLSKTPSIFDQLRRHSSLYDSIIPDDNTYNNFDLDEKYEQFTLHEILRIDQPEQENNVNEDELERPIQHYKEDHDMETEIA